MALPAEPIKFRCVRCGTLLGVGRAKAGAVVSCPRCGLELIVPPPAGGVDPPATFELETLAASAPAASGPAPATPTDPPPAPPADPPPSTEADAPALPFRVEPTPLGAEVPSLLTARPLARSRDLVSLPRAAILGWSFFATLALALAFAAGLLAGHFLWKSP